jgi:hypothetical protein
MGAVKQAMIQRQDLQRVAVDVLCAVGALKRCEFHEDALMEGNADLEAAYRLANARISRGEIRLPSYWSRRDFTDIIKSMFETSPYIDGCPYCARW